MSLLKLAQILAVALALSAYAAWLEGARPERGEDGGVDRTPMVGGILLYRTPEAERLWHDGSNRFVDVRTSIDYVYGHIAGALELPENEFNERFPSLRPELEKAKTIIIYCDSRRCARSLRVAMRLRTEGLEQTQIYPAGWNEWYLQGLPLERTATR